MCLIIKSHDLLRKSYPYADLNLADLTLSDTVLIDAMLGHPILLIGQLW